MTNSAFVTALGGAAAAYGFFWALLRLTQDRKEPQAVLQTLPFLSPVFGMIRWSMEFYPHMRERYSHLPIYTLRIPGTRLYVINSLGLIPTVQRQWRTLLFPPVSIKAAKVAMGASNASISILEHDMVTDKGFVPGMVKATHSTVSNGPALDNLNARAFEAFDEAMREFANTTGTTVNLFHWIGAQIMRATTDAVYGPRNPMRETKNLDAWQNFHPALMFMMLDILPQNIFFRKAVAGREQLVRSFAKYFADGSHKDGSAYVQKFTQHCIDQQIPENDIPRFLLGTVFNNVANTIPTAFWMIYRIFSDKAVMEACRSEVSKAVAESSEAFTIDLTIVLNSCPLLLSTYHEVFRYYGLANSVRIVSEDHLLGGQYLLKKGGLVMISARAQHNNPAEWGDNVKEFDYKRFAKTEKSEKRINPVAFRGFGGGTTLCPGRHFATSEILLLATLFLMRFDVQPKDGCWVHPSTAKSSQAEAVEQPDQDIEVKIIPRADSTKRPWRIIFSGRRDAGDLVLE